MKKIVMGIAFLVSLIFIVTMLYFEQYKEAAIWTGISIVEIIVFFVERHFEKKKGADVLKES